MRKFNQEVGNLQRGPSVLRLLAPVLAASAGLVLALGCERDQVSRTTVAQAPPAMPPAANGAPAPTGAPMTMPPGAVPPAGMPPGAMPPGQVAMPPRPSGQGALKWTLPKGWTETPGSGMRFATLNPPGPGKVELSVVVLPGAAGGEPANVNRWRGQIGLPPLDETAIAAVRKAVKSKAGEVAVYDFTSEGQAKSRMVTGLLATADGNTWFLKLMGDEEPVAKAKPGFMKYLATLHLD
jgi:hypothetical protein